MAKSKNGGTRSFIKGRIGSDVYSVGKDGKGSRQQVVRSLAEQVSNPRTESQMRGRMLMSTVMQAVAGLAPIIDHSFDGLPSGQPSISEFIRRNYALVKADAAAHPSSGNAFNINKYQEKGIKAGPWVISTGSVAIPAAVTPNSLGVTINLTSATFTVGGLKSALGLSADGYLTFVYVAEGTGVYYCRIKFSTTLADSTALTAANVPGLFSYEGNCVMAATADAEEYHIYISTSNVDAANNAWGVIVSEKIDGAWQHNTCTLDGNIEDIPQTADIALPTYPTGAAQFLNGGDL